MTQQSNDLPSREKFSNAKRALLERRLRGQSQGHNQVESIPVSKGTDPIPLSFAQERLWFLHQLDPQGSAYNMYEVVRIQGVLDKAVLTESFKTLIRRHQVLRTSFVVEGDRPWQNVAPDVHFEVPEFELRPFPIDALEREVQGLVKTEIRRPFDLAQSPLLRASLIRQAEDDHILVVTVHHIIFDEWSNELFWHELSVIYRALSVGELPALPELPVQYTDFTLWQKHQLETQMADQLVYWRQKLSGELPLIQLPIDRPRPAQQTFRGALKWRQLPSQLCQQLRSLNQELGTTMFMTLLAAFQLLLSRYTSQSDILIGTPIANRSRPETKGLIGLFLNTLVLRADLGEDMPFIEFASRTRKASLEAFAHQDLPFEKLVDELHPQRDKSHNPIFQVMFVHQKSALAELDLPGLVTSPVSLDSGVAKFDLTLFAQESNGALSAGLEYNIDLFDDGTADRILGHYQTLLESIVKDPQQPISALQLLPDDERNTLLYEWNDTATDPIRDICIHQLIEEQIAQKPESIAVADDAGQLSYRELNRRANQLAHYLRRLGVGPDVPVGLLLERSTDMIVSILAVLKAGGAYVPLDPDYPTERLAFMLKDARVPVVLTQSNLADVMPDHEANVCFLDRDSDLIAQESSANLELTANPDNLAYIIYTSGSTGQPRGVPVSHRNLVHSTLAREYFYPDRVGSFLLLSSFTFDSSVAGIFWTLCQGGKLVLPPQRIEQDMNRLSELIALHGVTHTLCLPSLHMLLLEIAEPAKLSTLKAVIVAGEACPLELIRQHYRLLPNADLYNEYGPTEGTVWSTACKIPADFNGDRVPIGRPIPNMQNYILDRYNQLAPIGVPGELCIAGPGITAGYLNAPEKTAQKFIQISFGKELAYRLYRTGDRARYLPDGNIDFLGRMDHQVKIRGNRVELGEIENVLRRAPGVKDAIVDLQDGNLIAYIVSNSSLASVPEWRTWLANTLPAYMIPTTFLSMEGFPRTPNGKLDRKALPIPGTHGKNDSFVAPRSETEQALEEIWKSILGVEHIGIHDNFFDIGGNSILSIRVFARIAENFDVHLPL
ncbi:MAG: non-ribosomal peptide synthetase, partial [Anaerolineales bacterium]